MDLQSQSAVQTSCRCAGWVRGGRGVRQRGRGVVRHLSLSTYVCVLGWPGDRGAGGGVGRGVKALIAYLVSRGPPHHGSISTDTPTCVTCRVSLASHDHQQASPALPPFLLSCLLDCLPSPSFDHCFLALMITLCMDLDISP